MAIKGVKAMAKRITTNIKMDSPNAHPKVTGSVPAQAPFQKRSKSLPSKPFQKRGK